MTLTAAWLLMAAMVSSSLVVHLPSYRGPFGSPHVIAGSGRRPMQGLLPQSYMWTPQINLLA